MISVITELGGEPSDIDGEVDTGILGELGIKIQYFADRWVERMGDRKAMAKRMAVFERAENKAFKDAGVSRDDRSTLRPLICGQ